MYTRKTYMLLLYIPLCVARHQDLFPLVPVGAEGSIRGGAVDTKFKVVARA